MPTPDNPQFNHTAATDRIRRALSLNETDVQSNRAGHMTEAQQERLKEKRFDVAWSWLGGIAFAVIGGCAMIMNASAGRGRSQDKDFGLLLVCGSVIAVCVVIAIMANMTDDARNNKIIAEQGPLKRRIKVSKQDRTYLVCVDKIWFTVADYVYDAFIEGEIYTLYYAPISQTLIAAEHQRDPLPASETPPDDPTNPLIPPQEAG